MRVAIIGSGNMARGIGTRAVEGKNQLTIYDRDIKKAKSLADELSTNKIKAVGKELGEVISTDLVILALPYLAIFEVVKKHKEVFEAKIIVDISNPIDFETFELIPNENTSGAEEIQKILPKSAKLVKAFNTTFYKTLIEGKVAGQKLDVLIASDDIEAGKTTRELAEGGGLRGIYTGPLKNARYLEGIQLIQMSIQEKLQSNWKSTLKFLP